MRRWWLLAAVAIGVLAVAAGAFWQYRRSQAVHAKVPAVPSPAVLVETEITVNGTVQAAKVVNVPVPVDGIIDRFLADVGQHVSEGEVLARIKNPRSAAAFEAAQLDAGQAQNHLSQLEAAQIAARLEVSRSEADAARVKSELERTEKTFERQQMMYREGVTPRLTYEKAEQEYNSLKAQSQNLLGVAKKAADRVDSITAELEPARKALEKKNSDLEDAQAEMATGEVNALSDGVVVARRGKPGEPVTPAMTDLFQIAADPAALQMVGPVEPKVADRIHAGQSADVEITGVPGTTTGVVREAKAGQVFIDLTSPSPAIKQGTPARVRIKLK
jgi:multidrug resistance efflux pump